MQGNTDFAAVGKRGPTSPKKRKDRPTDAGLAANTMAAAAGRESAAAQKLPSVDSSGAALALVPIDPVYTGKSTRECLKV